MIYFDNAATTPILPDVQEKIIEALTEYWGNPSSLHRKGFESEKVIREARAAVARELDVAPETLVFTSGATEGINTVLRGVSLMAHAKKAKRPNIVISAVEHSAVRKTAQVIEAWGVEIRVVNVDAHGALSAADVAEKVDDATILVSIMQVNNELGTVYPVAEIAEKIKKKNPNTLFMVDGTQALGKFVVRPLTIGCDFYISSGHKMHAPKGVGLLYIRRGVALPSLLTGGQQENGHRAGTENIPYIVGFCAALEEMAKRRGQEAFDPQIVKMNQRARERATAIPGLVLNSPVDASPYILNVAMSGIKAEVLLHFMEQSEMYLSSGSACSRGAASAVIAAIQLDEEHRDGAVRISFGRQNRLEEVDLFFDALEKAVQEIRSLTGGRK